MRFFYVAAALLGLASSAAAQGPAAAEPTEPVSTTPAPLGIKSTKASKILGLPPDVKLLPIPVLFYQEETGTGYGLGLLLSGALGDTATTRPSLIRAQYWTTTESQSLLQLTHTVYTPDEKYFLSGEISGYDLGLYYYGIGNKNDSNNESDLKYKLFIVNQRVQKKLIPNLFAGIQYRLTDISNIRYDAKTTDGASANSFITDPRLTDRERRGTTVSGIGPVITFDSRDVPLATYKGTYLDLSATFNTDWLGSDYKFTRYQLEVRHFLPIVNNKTILALHGLGQFHTGSVPFRELAGIGANLGGTLYNNGNLMRGLYEQRFRDRQLAVAEAEVRRYLFWRFDVAAFGGLGQVARNLDDFNGDFNYAGGAGVRFHFIRPVENGTNVHFSKRRANRVNLRLDYAVGTKSPAGFYFAIGEAF